MSGANDEAIKAAQSIRCETCARHANPGTRRPAKLVKPLEFNQEIAIDTLNLQDNHKKKIEVLSILDLATGYHVVKRISGRKSQNFAQDFVDAWATWAGPPVRVTCDQERGFLKDFVTSLEMIGTQVRFTAGQAHWQHGAVERQNFWFRNIWDKVVAHVQPQSSEVDYVLAMVAAAKNNLRRSHGYSPAQWLFGAEPRLGDPLADENSGLYQFEELRTPDEVWRRKQTIRMAAREAFIQSQADETLKRAVLGRPRVSSEVYEMGDYVYVYRVDKTVGGKARVRQNIGEWIGPGVVVGKEGSSYWVSRGGRCILCASEHLRPAESEELGAAFQSRVLKEDLLKLVNNLEDSDNDDTFADATGDVAHGKRPLPPQDAQDGRPRSRLVDRQRKRPGSPLPEGLQQPREQPSRDVEELLDNAVDQAFIVEKRVPKALIKQNDKEIKWEDIPDGEKELYRVAEAKQWDEHLFYEAVRIHPPEDAALLRRKVPKDRILRARFAYRDKNVAKRREDPSVPCKAKARLCVGGHMDPDLRTGGVNTEAPTASKMALLTTLFFAIQCGWELAAGDVEAAFLNGVESKRGLYFEVPKRGLPGVPEGALIEIVKGVFGLSNSPRLWWDKLAAELLKLPIQVGSEILKLEHHDGDPCFFLLRDNVGKLRGTLMCHVDDLLIATAPAEMEALQKSLSAIFPISVWERGDFEYTGSSSRPM